MSSSAPVRVADTNVRPPGRWAHIWSLSAAVYHKDVGDHLVPAPGGGFSLLGGTSAPHSFRAAAIASPKAFATGGGKTFPTWRYAAVFRPAIAQESGSPCKRDTICTVSLGGCPSGNAAPGGSSAIPSPSTPSFRHAARARVGPRSGPPCLVLPPTMVGAIPAAWRDHASAPGQPAEPIRSRSASPTVGGRWSSGSGQWNAAAQGCFIAISTSRGRSCGTPWSLA